MSERPWWLGDSRWPVLGVIALIGAALAAIGGDWLEATLFFSAAAVLAAVTVRTARR